MSAPSLTEDEVQGFKRVWLRSDALEVAVLPELGGKLQTIRLAGSGHNVLLEPPEFPYHRAWRGAPFDRYDTSGFDECFPTVGASVHQGVDHSDHGELWSAPWTFERQSASAALMRAQVQRVPWTFSRRLSVTGATLRLEYEVVSSSPTPLDVMWSAHPLLSASAGSRVTLPASVREVRVESSTGDRLGRKGARVPWPVANIERLVGPVAGTADKLFTTGPLSEGEASLEDAASGVTTTFRFDPKLTPYLGLWVSQGGWPADPKRKRHFTVALEPCSSPVDLLSEAVANDTAWRLGPGETKRWILEVALSRRTGAR